MYQYDNNGRLVLTSRPDGTEETRSYDASRMLTSINDTAPWGTIDANSITIDAAGRTTVENETTPGQPFTVPAAVSVTYDADNRLATVNGTAVTFDADGNMLSGPAPGTLANTGYSYNARNQLIEGADGYAYTYGVLDNRIGIQSPLNSFTTFVVDPHGALDRVLSRTVNDDDPLFNYLEQGDGMNLFSQTQDSFGAILKQQTQRDPRLSIKQMKQSASQASFKKRLLGGMLPPVLALLIIYFLTFLCELLINISNSTSSLHGPNPILRSALSSCSLLVGTYVLAIPISLFVWLPYYMSVPYPSKWWEPITAIFTAGRSSFIPASLR